MQPPHSPDSIARLCISTWLSSPTSFHPSPRSNGTPQFAVLAGIVLESDVLKCITVASGTKCLPADRLAVDGVALHDSHAEVLARRGLVRWLLEEIVRFRETGASHWIELREQKYKLKEDVRVHMYVSTLPCGDASTLALALAQDPAMAALKSQSALGSPSQGLIRGRNGYEARGVLRTKPGRADSAPTKSMSCSDKIALWTLVGLQGAILSTILEPIYLDALVIGEVDDAVRDEVGEECRRAFDTRIQSDLELPSPFRQHPPAISFTSVPFVHSRSQTAVSQAGSLPAAASESVSWIADAGPAEASVNGIKRGATTKSGPKAARSRLSKAAIYDFFKEVVEGEHGLYTDAKREATTYAQAKSTLRSPGGPLHGWVIIGGEWERFS